MLETGVSVLDETGVPLELEALVYRVCRAMLTARIAGLSEATLLQEHCGGADR